MSAYTGTPPLPPLLAGDVPSGAADWAAIIAALHALTDPPTDYSASFVIGASTTPPTKGNSVYTAEYRRLGPWVDYTFSVDVGSTWAPGTGTYRFPLPFAATGNKRQVGRAFVADQGTALLTGAIIFGTPSDTWLSIVMANAGGAFLGAAGPGTVWASTDIMQGSITYLAA